MERLDRILSEVGACSRRECVALVRRGLVTVDGVLATSAAQKVPDGVAILVRGVLVERRRPVVCAMNKPAGFVTSTAEAEAGSRTVMELLPENLRRQGVVPVGRLDKDTEGLLLFTNDGDLLHRIISPKFHVEKSYLVGYDGVLSEASVGLVRDGLVLRDGSVCKGATIEQLGNGVCTITISEGMYHQVKRMFAAIGCHVTYLKRVQIGPIKLGDLESGAVRELSVEDVAALRGSVGM